MNYNTIIFMYFFITTGFTFVIHGPDKKILEDEQKIFHIGLENREGSLFKELKSGAERELQEVIPILKKGVKKVGVNDDGTHVAIGELIDEVFAEDIDDNEENDDEDLNPLNFKLQYSLMYQNSEDKITEIEDEIVEDMTIDHESDDSDNEDDMNELMANVEAVTMPASEEVEEEIESGTPNNPYSYTIHSKPSSPVASYNYPQQYYYYTPYNYYNTKLVSIPPVYTTYLPPRPIYHHQTYPVYYNTYLPQYHTPIKYYY